MAVLIHRLLVHLLPLVELAAKLMHSVHHLATASLEQLVLLSGVLSRHDPLIRRLLRARLLVVVVSHDSVHCEAMSFVLARRELEHLGRTDGGLRLVCVGTALSSQVSARGGTWVRLLPIERLESRLLGSLERGGSVSHFFGCDVHLDSFRSLVPRILRPVYFNESHRSALRLVEDDPVWEYRD